MQISVNEHPWLQWLTIKHKFGGYVIFGGAVLVFFITLMYYLNLNPLTVSRDTKPQSTPIEKVQASLVQDQDHLIDDHTQALIYQQDQDFQKTTLKPRISVATTTLSSDISDKDLASAAEAKGSQLLNHPITSSGGIGGYNGIMIVIFDVGDDYHAAVIVRPFMRGVVSDDWVQSLLDSQEALLESGTKASLNQFVLNINQALVKQLQTHYFNRTVADQRLQHQLQMILWISGLIMLVWLILNWLMMTNLTVDAYGDLMYQTTPQLFNKQLEDVNPNDVFTAGVILDWLNPEETIHEHSSSGGWFSGGGGGFSGGDGGGFV